MMGLVPLKEEEEKYIALPLHMYALRKGPVSTQQGVHLQDRRRVLTRS